MPTGLHPPLSRPRCWSSPGRSAAAGASSSSFRSHSISPRSPSCSPAAIRSPRSGSNCRRNTTRSPGCGVGALAAHPGFTLFADDRETLAALIYYVHPHPFDAVKWKLKNRLAKDQWELTDGLSQHRGENFLLVSEHELIPEMRPSFAAIDRLQPVVIPIGPGASRAYTLYLARDFKGYSWDRR